MSTKPELSKMKVSELRELAEQLGVEAPSKMLKAQLIKAILEKQKKPAAKPKPPREKAKPTIPVEKVHGIFVNYRQGMFRQSTQNALIRIDGVTSASSASKYIGRNVVWRSQTGKKLVGKVVSTHGKGGVVRSRFKKGLPGQAIGASVEMV